MKLAEKWQNKTIAGVNKNEKLPTWLKYGLDILREPFWYDVSMLEGKCPKCGTQYFGWALRWPRHQTCPKCGIALKITQDGRSFEGYSPFNAEKYSINPPTNVPLHDDKEKDSPVQKE